jgi:4-oxalocrotonate tautomerase
MPMVHIELMEGRTEEQLRAMVARVTEAMVATVDAPTERVSIIISEVTAEHWAVGGLTVADQRAAAGQG